MLNRISRITFVALLSGFTALYGGMTFAQDVAQPENTGLSPRAP